MCAEDIVTATNILGVKEENPTYTVRDLQVKGMSLDSIQEANVHRG